MTARSPFMFSHVVGRASRSTSNESLQAFPPERCTDLVRRQGGLLTVFPAGKPAVPSKGKSQRMTRLLLNVNIERSLGPVHVVMSSENTVKDLVKTAIDIYVKEKRRPLLDDIVPDRFELHYSPFSLDSLSPDEKLVDLGSRNFFLCPKPSKPAYPSCFGKPESGINSPPPLTNLMALLL